MKNIFMDWFIRFIKLIERPRFPEPNSPSNENKKEGENGIR